MKSKLGGVKAKHAAHGEIFFMKGDIKMVAPVKFNSKEDLYRFSELASKENYGIYITTAFGQLDAKSLLALFTILGKDVNVVASDCANAEDFAEFLAKYNRG